VSEAPVTIVLVHGAGNTSLVWEDVQAHLRQPSLAVDLPGRRDRPGDITSVSIDSAARSLAHDIADETDGRVVLVGHSAGGIVLPALAALLDRRVDHLVFVAGLCAQEGRAVGDVFRPGELASTKARLVELQRRYRGHMLAPACSARPAGTIEDPKIAMQVDSLNYITQTMSWAGVSPALRRTFVRCLRDRFQSRGIQAQLAENCDASTVVDIDAGHAVALDAPAELAAILDRITNGWYSPA
jgi:pimeloyl-ACP methyl ester carboxylesterase